MDIWRKISINNDNKWRTDREDEGEDEKAQSESVRKGHGGISSSSGGLNPPEQELCAHLTVILCRKHVCYEKWPNLVFRQDRGALLHALLRTGSFSAHKRGSLWCRKKILLSLPKKSRFEVNVYPDVEKSKANKVAAGRVQTGRNPLQVGTETRCV